MDKTEKYFNWILKDIEDKILIDHNDELIMQPFFQYVDIPHWEFDEYVRINYGVQSNEVPILFFL